MAAMNVSIEIISRETIKPSSPTPLHLQNYQLSFLDQLAPPIYFDSILFYESNPNITNAEKSNQLKASLSESLTHFYPLAGRVVNGSIHCNDEGVPYIEAHASSKLREVIHDANIGEFDKFLPSVIHDINENGLLAIQVNFFDCGGLAIGVCISHKLADATSREIFLNSWAATLRGHGDSILMNPPIFETAMLFPPKDSNLFPQFKPAGKDKKEKIEKKEKIVTKVFVFSSSTLEILRENFSDDVSQKYPIRATRVEALTAFLSNRYVTVTKPNTKADEIFSVTHAINIRSKMEPPLSKYHFGNYFTIVEVLPSIEEVEGARDGEFVRKMRGALKGIDAKYVVDNIRESNEFLDHYFNVIVGKMVRGDGLNCTSWCRMGAYEVDFGWGKPVRVGYRQFQSKNVVCLVDSNDGTGIEAWISLEEEEMAKLEADQELISYISPTMSSF